MRSPCPATREQPAFASDRESPSSVCDNEVIPLFVPESQTKSHHHCYTALRTDFKCKMGCCESVSHPVVSDPL